MLWCCSPLQCNRSSSNSAHIFSDATEEFQEFPSSRRTSYDPSSRRTSYEPNSLASPNSPGTAAVSSFADGYVNRTLDDDSSPYRRPSNRWLTPRLHPTSTPDYSRQLVREIEATRRQQNEEDTRVLTVVTLTDKRSWRNWWSSRRKTTFVTICEPPSETSPSNANVSSSRNSPRSSGSSGSSSGNTCACLSVFPIGRKHRKDTKALNAQDENRLLSDASQLANETPSHELHSPIIVVESRSSVGTMFGGEEEDLSPTEGDHQMAIESEEEEAIYDRTLQRQKRELLRRGVGHRPLLERANEQELMSPDEEMPSVSNTSPPLAQSVLEENFMEVDMVNQSHCSSNRSSPLDDRICWRTQSGNGLPKQSSIDSGGTDEDLRNELRSVSLWQTDSSTTPSDEEGIIRRKCSPITQPPLQKIQCLALWQLRSTLEDDGTDSDIPRTGATTEEHSPETEVLRCAETLNSDIQSSKNRRSSYRAVLAQRMKQLEGPAGSDTSKTSIDSADFDQTSICGQSEIYNTSIDSAFSGSIDQTCETQRPRNYQMTKTDSGYRSIEVSTKYFGNSMSQCNLDEHNLSSDLPLPKLPEVRSSIDSNASSEGDQLSKSPKGFDESSTEVTLRIKNPSDNRNRRQWHSICAEPSFMETESSGDMTTLPPEISALAVVNKRRREIENGDGVSGCKRTSSLRFRTARKYSINQLRVLQRDYSIDEKSDSLFREFSKTEALYFPNDSWTNTVPRCDRRNRRNIRHIELDETSPMSLMKKLSPADSIEEEINPETSRDSSRTREQATASTFQLPNKTISR